MSLFPKSAIDMKLIRNCFVTIMLLAIANVLAADEEKPKVSPEFEALIEAGEVGGVISATGIDSQSVQPVSKEVLQYLSSEGHDEFVEAVRSIQASGQVPMPPVITGVDGEPLPPPHIWIKGRWHNRPDWFYQSWNVDGEAWVTYGKKPDGPPYPATRMVIWFTSVCDRASRAEDNVSRIEIHEHWSHNGPPPPGQGYCLVSDPCFHTVAIIDGKTAYLKAC